MLSHRSQERTASHDVGNVQLIKGVCDGQEYFIECINLLSADQRRLWTGLGHCIVMMCCHLGDVVALLFVVVVVRKQEGNDGGSVGGLIHRGIFNRETVLVEPISASVQ